VSEARGRDEADLELAKGRQSPRHSQNDGGRFGGGRGCGLGSPDARCRSSSIDQRHVWCGGHGSRPRHFRQYNHACTSAWHGTASHYACRQTTLSVVARLAFLCLAVGLAVVRPGDAVAFNDTTVAAEPGAMAAGRDITGNTINFGLTPEQVRELTEATARGATGPPTTAIVDLGKRLGVTEDATKTLLRIVGEQDVPLERLSETLNRVANDYKRLQVQAAALNPDNPTARGLVERAQIAITAGDLAEAHQLLAQTRQVQIAAAQEAMKLLNQAQTAVDAELLGAAASTSADGDVAIAEQHYDLAADRFKQAVALVPAGHSDETASYLEREATALYLQGHERGSNAALIASVSIWNKTLQEYPRERKPLDWARAQLGLGDALWMLGWRESGTAHLDEAVTVYRAVLQEYTRDRAPLDRAATHINLGAVLINLWEKERWDAIINALMTRLEEAVAAYRAALEEDTRGRAPLDWAAPSGASAMRLSDWANKRVGRRGWRRRWRRIVPRWRKTRAIERRSTGLEFKMISEMSCLS
jgi:tetratricopeptide (TPR) repeat protein